MSASVAYIVTESVRHIAVWTARSSTAGRSQPLCGRYAETYWKDEDTPPKNHFQWPDYPDHENYESDMKKPICKNCLKTAAAVAEVAQS